MSDDHQTFEEILAGVLGANMEASEFEDADFQLDDESKMQILMHREGHFGGSFSVMIDYYEKDGIGIIPGLKAKHIQEVAQIEAESGQDLAKALLGELEWEAVADCRKAYETLREVYESDEPEGSPARLISDLILTEEIEPTKELEAIAAKGSSIVPSLLNILEEPKFQDLLFPGYGIALDNVVTCLGMIGDTSSIVPLFEASRTAEFPLDDFIFLALKGIGEPAKDFLLKVMQQTPIVRDNALALQGLIDFAHDPLVAKTCLTTLQERPDFYENNDLILQNLILGCGGLTSDEDREQFVNLVEGMEIDEIFHYDIDMIINGWESPKKESEVSES